MSDIIFFNKNTYIKLTYARLIYRLDQRFIELSSRIIIFYEENSVYYMNVNRLYIYNFAIKNLSKL